MVNKSKGINKSYLSLTANFYSKYLEAAEDVGLAILVGNITSKKLIEKKVVKVLTPIFNDYFSDSIHASNKLVSAGISKLADDYNIPFKYNKDLLDSVNSTSIWTGYYDSDVTSSFTKKELTAMKKVILSAKYGGWEEKDLITGIKNVATITDKRAILLARSATTGLDSTTNLIYYSKKTVQNKYNLVWHQNTAYERHRHMNGVVANKDGMFLDPATGSLIPPPPYIFSPWNCLCTTSFEAK